MSRINYLEKVIGYDDGFGVAIKLCKLQQICGTINSVFRDRIHREMKLIFYKIMVVPVLSNSSGLWTRTKNQKSHVQASEMKIVRSFKICTKLDYIMNEDLREE